MILSSFFPLNNYKVLFNYLLLECDYEPLLSFSHTGLWF